jgi:uncharacterized protein (TIGR00255 family)
MTGYGSAECGDFKVEIRSLNHRYIDITFRMPQDLLKYEIPLRNIIKGRFSRGKFDVIIALTQERIPNIGFDMGRARSIYNSLNQLKDALRLTGEIGIETIMTFRDMILTEAFEYNIDSLFEAFNVALDNLSLMREEEGRNLRDDLRGKLDLLAGYNEQLSRYAEESPVQIKERLTERVANLLGDVKIDEARILQEVALLIERADINEEITRIDSHLRQMRKLISEGDTIGRKLDFILQELNREVNTISSKSSDYRISSLLVDMRAEIEKMREQAQNIQ